MDKSPPRRDAPYAMYVILAGLFATTAVALSSIFHYADATDAVTALGPITGIIGTLVGAYFGLRGASLAQQNAADAETKRAEGTKR
jgi:Zn-dependent protease